MTTTDTRTPIWRRRWAQITAGSALGLVLVAGAAAGGTTLARPHATVIRPAANTAPATPKATSKPAKTTQPPAPAAAGAVPAGYVTDILNAGITASQSWIASTGQQLVRDWQAGYTAAWTDANVLTPGGIYAYHLATFDQITAHDFGVTPPAQGIEPQTPATAPAAPAQPAAPAPASNPPFTSAVAVVIQYYQDINDHDYSDAWNLGGDNLNGGAGYAAWVAGYDTTASVDVTASGTYDDGTVWTHLTATQTDGTVKTYDGTYTVSNGVIVSANITQTS